MTMRRRPACALGVWRAHEAVASRRPTLLTVGVSAGRCCRVVRVPPRPRHRQTSCPPRRRCRPRRCHLTPPPRLPRLATGTPGARLPPRHPYCGETLAPATRNWGWVRAGRKPAWCRPPHPAAPPPPLLQWKAHSAVRTSAPRSPHQHHRRLPNDVLAWGSARLPQPREATTPAACLPGAATTGAQAAGSAALLWVPQRLPWRFRSHRPPSPAAAPRERVPALRCARAPCLWAVLDPVACRTSSTCACGHRSPPGTPGMSTMPAVPPAPAERAPHTPHTLSQTQRSRACIESTTTALCGPVAAPAAPLPGGTSSPTGPAAW